MITSVTLWWISERKYIYKNVYFQYHKATVIHVKAMLPPGGYRCWLPGDRRCCHQVATDVVTRWLQYLYSDCLPCQWSL